MQEARFYTLQEDNNKVKCQLCPHVCIIGENTRGKCGVRINKSGKLYSENYGKAIGLHSEPVEKKPLYNFHPGRQILSLGTYGCNLDCSFCQNYHISKPLYYTEIATNNVSVDEVINKVIASANSCGISYTFNEPTVWYEYMMDIAGKVKEKGYANAVVSNGYINPKPLEKLLDVIDGFNIDLKSFTDEFYRKYTGSTLAPVKNTLKTIARNNIHLEITNLVIPGLNDDPKTFKEMTKWISGELGKDTPLHINRYFPSYKMNIEQTPLETITVLREIALENLHFVYCGNVLPLNGESNTICPGCNRTVIKRTGHKKFTDSIDSNGNCIYCKYKIALLK